MNKLIEFTNNFFGDLNVIVRKGEPWFIAKEVAEILKYKSTFALTKTLDDDESATTKSSIRSDNGVDQKREISIINESGIYHAIFKSRKEEAKNFRKWVTDEVIPSIRKTGKYEITKEWIHVREQTKDAFKACNRSLDKLYSNVGREATNKSYMKYAKLVASFITGEYKGYDWNNATKAQLSVRDVALNSIQNEINGGNDDYYSIKAITSKQVNNYVTRFNLSLDGNNQKVLEFKAS